MLIQTRFARLSQFAVFAYLYILTESTLTSSMANTEEDFLPLRLPNTTLPIKYHLHITTYIHQERLPYTGNVTIELAVKKSTDEIVLHSKLLDIVVVNLLDLNQNQLFENLEYTNEKITDFMKISLPIELKVGQQYRLEILFLGGIRLQHFGFYRTTYLDKLNNNTIPLASTQFEPTSARLAFPCFDEPAFKARFVISVTHGSNYTTISNMPIEGQPIQSSDGEMTTTTFQETPIMSTYLIAFVVSNYDHISEFVNGIEHRVFFPPKSKDQGKKALKNAIASVTALENYLGIKYALPKLDHFPLDKTYGLAMENWGIITYNKRSMVSGIEGTNSEEIIKMTGVQNHEIAHQWFGNLVSPKWWTYVWLNEGFATYFGYITTELVHPEWKVNEIFIRKEVDAIIHWPITHPMTQYVEKEADIKSTFDVVCYQKSSSVIKMFHHAIGLKTFIKGVASFLTKFKYSVADDDDLLGALQAIIQEESDEHIFKNNIGISSIMKTWTLNQGIPLVTVIRNYDNETITFRQRSNSKHLDEQWWIPLSFATASNLNFDQTKADFLLPPHKEFTVHLRDINLNISNDEWLIVNKQQTGLFFVNYDDHNFDLIAETLNTDYESIHMLNRALLFRDLVELIERDINDMSAVLLALQYLKNEQELLPWNSASDLILDMISKLSGSHALEKFKAFIRGIVSDIFHSVHQILDTTIDSISTSKILEVACTVDLPECLEYTKTLTKKYFFNGEDIHDSRRDIALCHGIKYSTTEEFQELLSKMTSTNISSGEYSDIVFTIRCIQSPENIKHFLYFLLGENSTFDAMPQIEKVQYVSFWYNYNYFSRPFIMHFMLENYKTIFKTWNTVEHFLKISNNVPEDDGQKDEFMLLLENIKEYFVDEAKIEDLKIGSKLKQNEHFKKKHEKNIYEWISERERTVAMAAAASAAAKSDGSFEIRPSLTAARYIVAAGFLSNLITFV